MDLISFRTVAYRKRTFPFSAHLSNLKKKSGVSFHQKEEHHPCSKNPSTQLFLSHNNSILMLLHQNPSSILYVCACGYCLLCRLGFLFRFGFGAARKDLLSLQLATVEEGSSNDVHVRRQSCFLISICVEKCPKLCFGQKFSSLFFLLGEFA